MAADEDGHAEQAGDSDEEPISTFHSRAREVMEEDREVLDALDE